MRKFGSRRGVSGPWRVSKLFLLLYIGRIADFGESFRRKEREVGGGKTRDFDVGDNAQKQGANFVKNFTNFFSYIEKIFLTNCNKYSIIISA